MPRRLTIAVSLQRAREEAALGRTHKALRLLDDLLRQKPAHPEALQLQEELRLLERREKRLRRQPRSAQAQLEAGFSYLMVGRNGDAIEAFGRAREIDSSLYLAHLPLGMVHHKEGRMAAALLALGKWG